MHATRLTWLHAGKPTAFGLPNTLCQKKKVVKLHFQFQMRDFVFVRKGIFVLVAASGIDVGCVDGACLTDKELVDRFG